VRNIAEVRAWPAADSARRYKITRGDAMDCAASLDAMQLRKSVTAIARPGC
jgi:hypothetical protein